MSPREQGLRALVVALAALALGVGLFFVLMEPVTETAPRGPQGLARTDPSYPARLALEGVGLRSSAQYGLGQLPPIDETIVLIGNGVEEQRALVGRLEPWVRAGGHLVLFPPERDLSALLSALQPEEPAPELAAESAPEAEDEAADALDGAEAPGEDWAPGEAADPAARGGQLWARFGLWIDRDAALTGAPPALLRVIDIDGRALQLRVDPSLSIGSARSQLVWWGEPAASPGGGAAARVVAARVRYGAGAVTAAVDERFLLLRPLTESPEGARWLWSLLSLAEPPAQVRFVLQGGQGSVWTLLWRRAPLFVLAAGLWGLAAALRLRAHFGPPEGQAAPARRSLLEHVDGVGAFLWRRVGAGPLLAPLRRRALRQLERSAPGLSDATPADRTVRLAALTGLAEADLKLAFDVDLDDDQAGLLAQLRLLQQVERLGRRGERGAPAAPARPVEPPR